MGLVGALLNTATAIKVPTNNTIQYKPINPKRLLICAPSNAAVDEITRRLMDGIYNSAGNLVKPKIVRIGNQNQVHEDVFPVTLVKIV